jgi:hypothetical protein
MSWLVKIWDWLIDIFSWIWSKVMGFPLGGGVSIDLDNEIWDDDKKDQHH